MIVTVYIFTAFHLVYLIIPGFVLPYYRKKFKKSLKIHAFIQARESPVSSFVTVSIDDKCSCGATETSLEDTLNISNIFIF